MSDKIINYYEFLICEPDLKEIKQKFKNNVSKYNVPFFEAGTEAEKEFENFCQASGLAIQKKTIVEYDGKGNEDSRFLFLVLKDDDGICVLNNEQNFIDLSTACPGGGAFGSCGHGAKQAQKVHVEMKCAERVSKLGLVSVRYPDVPRILLISATVAAALKEAGASGCEIVPTDRSDCFQFLITVDTVGPAQIGWARMGKRCPICGVAKLFFGSSERYFHHGDLMPTDFQMCRLYAADNVGEFEILNGFPIVSQRIFNLLLALKIKGLDRYSSDPLIRYAVVQLRE